MAVRNEAELSLAVRLWIYQKERFPLFQTGLLVAAFTFSAAAYSRILRQATEFIAWQQLVAGIVTSLGFFLLLRLFDEFKDAADDAAYRPYRPVPRGLVSLRVIGWGIVCVIAGILLLNLLLMPVMLWAVLLVLGYILLMWREFFVPEWLRQRHIAYLVTHMLVMPLIDFYTTGLDWMNADRVMPPGLILFLLVTFLNGCVIEIGRKIRAPQDEEKGVDTYSALWGGRRAALVWLMILGATGLLAFCCCYLAGYGWVALPVLLVFWCVCAYPAAAFRRHGRGGRKIELAAGIWTIAMYLIIGGVPMLIEWGKKLWS